MAKESDVVVENFTPGVMQRLDIGYETLKALNPRIVFCSVSGFGQTGPYAAKPAYDQIMQSVSGLMSVTGEPDGPPVKDRYCGHRHRGGHAGCLRHNDRAVPSRDHRLQ